MGKFLLKVCNKDTKRKSLRHSVNIFIDNLEYVLRIFLCGVFYLLLQKMVEHVKA